MAHGDDDVAELAGLLVARSVMRALDRSSAEEVAA